MKPLMLIGALLTAAAILALLFHNGIHYIGREKYPRTGDVQVTVKQEKFVSVPPVFGGLALASGVILMVLAARK